VKFGILVYPFFAREMNPREAYEYAYKMIGTARKVGFDSFFASQHFATGPTTQIFQPFPLLAALSSSYPEMVAGTYMCLAPFYNPVYLAEVSATLDVITNGKFILGLAAGYRDKEFEIFGIKKKNRHARLKEIVEILNKLFRENEVSYEGKYYKINKVQLSHKPLGNIPIWIGADTEGAISKIPEFADVWAISPRHSKKFLEKAVPLFRESMKKYGKEVKELPLCREMHVAKTDDDAIKNIENAFIRTYHGFYHREKQPGERYDLELLQLLEDRAIVGSPDTCIDKLAKYIKDFGVTHVLFRVYWDGLDPEKMVESARMFGDKVIPYFKEKEI
jgi:alkanesulfonate monooxygenase SsuD/methylene tetrahydromethanopterin reductase-like flavin-dependent oxidoreductase (luciferase family)